MCNKEFHFIVFLFLRKAPVLESHHPLNLGYELRACIEHRTLSYFHAGSWTFAFLEPGKISCTTAEEIQDAPETQKI